VNVFQTVPTIALLAMLIPFMGIGMKPAIFALFLYSLLPLLRNTYSGIREVDGSIVEAARGMGFGTFQRLFKIELPLAFPYILSGIRLTTVYIISWTTLAALIGAGGLGDLIIAGMSNNDNFLIFTGTISAIILAVIVDVVLGIFSKNRNGLTA
jgi:osmoprotectant transport system permease protein